MRDRRPLALLLWGGTITASALAMVIIVATRDLLIPAAWGFRGASEAFGVTCGTVGLIVALRKPDNLNGWLFSTIGVFFAMQALVNEYVILSFYAVPGGLPLTTALAWTLTWLWVPPLGVALIFLPLLFPTGHLLSPRWRAVAALGGFATVAFTVGMAFAPGPIQNATFIENPLAAPGVDYLTYGSLVLGPLVILLIIPIGLSLASLVLRFRRAPTDARRQIKWFALAALIAGTVDVLYILVSLVVVDPTVIKAFEILVVLSLMGLPAAAGLAILRYRLYEIDRVISRSISYGVVTGMLVAIFLLVNLVLQWILSSVTTNNALAVAGSTLLVAGLFTPVRRRVQSIVDRRFNRARYDAERTATAFSSRIRDAIDLPTLTNELDGTVRTAVAPSSLRLWLRGGGM